MSTSDGSVGVIQPQEKFLGYTAGSDLNFNSSASSNSNLCAIYGDIFSPLKQLLQIYGMHVRDYSDFPDTLFVSGGLQQYLIRSKLLEQKPQNQPRKGDGSNHTTFHDLPDSLQLQIFSFLPAADLCRISTVCSHWLMLGADNLLWQKRLNYDLPKWTVIGHRTNPDMLEECHSDYKEIYLQCSPEVKHSLNSADNVGVQQITNMVATTVRSFLPKKIPKFAIFGPGLESSTSAIMRKMLEGESEMFVTTGMFPGQFGGIGSGFTMKMNQTTAFNMVALYTSTWQERHNTPITQRLQINRLLMHNNEHVHQDGHGPSDSQADKEDEDKVKSFEVNPSVRELCRTLDGLIFVVDASEDEANALSVARSELFSMIREMWCVPGAPVVVLSCRPSCNTAHVSCIEVARKLSLSKLNRPWQVNACTVEQMQGVVEAINWGVQMAQDR